MIRCNLRLLIARKELQENRRISYSDIHEATGIATSTLSNLANNNVNRFHAGTLEKLCEYFDADVCDLLEYVPEPAPEGNGHQREPVAEAEAA